MKSFIRKFLLLSIVFIFSSHFCSAAEELTVRLGEDYLITTEQSIRLSTVDNSSIVQLNSFFTILNEKNILLLHPLKLGSTSFKIYLNDYSIDFNVSVKSSPVKIKPTNKKDYEIMQLDIPETLTFSVEKVSKKTFNTGLIR